MVFTPITADLQQLIHKQDSPNDYKIKSSGYISHLNLGRLSIIFFFGPATRVLL